MRNKLEWTRLYIPDNLGQAFGDMQRYMYEVCGSSTTFHLWIFCGVGCGVG